MGLSQSNFPHSSKKTKKVGEDTETAFFFLVIIKGGYCDLFAKKCMKVLKSVLEHLIINFLFAAFGPSFLCL